MEDAILAVIDLADEVHRVRQKRAKKEWECDVICNGKPFVQKRRERLVIFRLRKIAASTEEALVALERFEKLGARFLSNGECRDVERAVDDLFLTLRTTLNEVERRLKQAIRKQEEKEGGEGG